MRRSARLAAKGTGAEGEGEGETEVSSVSVSSSCDDTDNSSLLHMVTKKRRIEEETNPLFNPVILSELWRYLPIKDIKNIRLVCKLWQDTSLKQWRHRVRLPLDDIIPLSTTSKFVSDAQRRYFSCQQVSCGSDHLKLNHFVNMFMVATGDDENDPLKIMQYRYQNYKMCSWKDQVVEPRIEVFRSFFWFNCGSWLKDLTIYQCVFSGVSSLEKIIYEMTPNLEKLSLIGIVVRENEDVRNEDNFIQVNLQQLPDVREQKNLKEFIVRPSSTSSFPLGWLNFFRHFPQIEKISFEYGCIANPNVQNEHFMQLLLAAIHIRLADPTKLCVKHLDIIQFLKKTAFPSVIASLLERARFPLETLKIYINTGTEDSVVKSILKSISKTIRTLTMVRNSKAQAMQNFPFGISLNSLEQLGISGVFTHSFEFLRFTPNLKKVRLLDVIQRRLSFRRVEDQVFEVDLPIPDPLDEVVMSQVKLPHLQEFLTDFRIEKKSSVKILARVMPNLKVLNLQISSVAFSQIFEQTEYQENLRELRISVDDKINDDIITGEYSGRNWGGQGPSKWNKSCGNFSSLKELELFKLNLWTEKESRKCSHKAPKVTDVSIRHGLLLLPKLRSLNMQMSEQMKQDSLQLLMDKGVKVETTLFEKCSCGRTNLSRQDLTEDGIPKMLFFEDGENHD